MSTSHAYNLIRRTVLGATALAMVAILGCDTGPADSLFDPDRSFASDPVISSIEPPEETLAGIGTITIIGQNFSPEPADNLVYFDATKANVVEASPTQLKVRSPNLPKRDIHVKVTVIGAEKVSNAVTYSLEPAVKNFGNVIDFEEPFAITTDADGNIYVSLFANAASVGIKRIAPDGTRSDYVSTTFKWDDLELADDGHLYGVRGVQAVFRFPPGGGERENWAILPDRSARLVALDFDDHGNAWTGGRGGNLYRIDPSIDITTYPFEENVEALAAVGGQLYVASVSEGTATVWRFPITSEGLGDREKFFALTEQAGAGIRPLSLAVTADGEVLVGTDAPDPLILVRSDGSWDFFYPGLLKPPAFSLAWGPGTTLFMSRTDSEAGEGRILEINTQRVGTR